MSEGRYQEYTDPHPDEIERMTAPEGYQFRVISRYSGEQGHLAGSAIETVAVTCDLDEAFRRKNESERNYSDAWVTIEKVPMRRAGKGNGSNADVHQD